MGAEANRIGLMLLTRFLIVLKYLFVNLVDPLHNVLDFGQGSILIVVDRDSILHPQARIRVFKGMFY